MCKSVRALVYPQYDYYRLTKDFGVLKAGTIFFHDPNDDVYGSVAQGCLKLCWTPDGGCYGGICGGTVILHYDFAKTDWFEEVARTTADLMRSLEAGSYKMEVHADGSWDIHKYGSAI